MIEFRVRDIFASLAAVLFGGGVGELSRERALAVLNAEAAFAGLVVTVFGIWIAIVFPRMLGGLASGATVEQVPERAKYRSMVRALYRSCFSLCSIVFVTIVLSLYEMGNSWLSRFVSVFCCLCFFSVVASLWGALAEGERAVVVQINSSLVDGVKKRIRRRNGRP